MEEFLSGERFEEMAREYNKKYASVSVLKANVFDKGELKELFGELYLLFHSLYFRFGKIPKFKSFFNEVEKYIEKSKKVEKVLEIELTEDYSKQAMQVQQRRANYLVMSVLRRFNCLKFFSDENLLELQCDFVDLMADFYAKS